MKRLLLAALLSLSCFGMAQAQTNNVTVSVDMSNYVAAFDTVYLSGTYNGWSGTSNAMTDMGSGVWETTVAMPDGHNEYKFTIDDWTVQENFTAGMYCTTTISGFTNRYLSISTDSVIPIVCFDSCQACGATAPTGNKNVTFQVDMSQAAITYTTVYVSGAFNGWSGTANALVDQGNDIWTATIPIAVGQTEFKFSTDDWAQQENFVGGEACTITSFGFTNRLLQVSADMTIDTVCWNSCIVCPSTPPPPPDTVAVTFQVDMSQYGGTFTTPEVNGTFNGWCGNCNTMTDQGNGIWSTTIDLIGDSAYEFKFSHDAWTGQENFVGGESCTVTNGGFTNRALNLGVNDTTLSLVCWDACDTCSVVAQQDTVAVTFQVDMSQYGGTFTTPEVNGSFNGWCGNCNAMSDQGNGIWSTTIDIIGNADYEFKFSHDAWTGQENFVGGEPCTVTIGGFTNRELNLGANDTTLSLVCWDACDTCGVAPPVGGDSTSVTFNVDMSNYVAAFTTVHVSGTFNGWSGTANPLSDQGNGIWSGTVDIYADSAYEFKYTIDDWTAQENFVGGESCTVTNGGFTNRALNVMGDSTLAVNCWNSCDTCVVSPPAVAGASPYCSTFASHFAAPNDTAQAVYLTIANVSDTSMIVSIESANANALDELIVTNGSGAAISAIDTSVPGIWSRTLTWTGNAPDSAAMNVLWSNAALPGNAQLTTADVFYMVGDTCPATGPPAVPDTVTVTFNVDMSLYGAAFSTVAIGGTFNGWSPTANALSDQGNGIWSGSLDLFADTAYEFLYSVDTAAVQESFTGGESCTVTNGGFTNRALTVTADSVLNLVCWETCDTCGAPPPPVPGDTTSVTFNVDMTNYTSAFTTVYVSGTMNGWSGNANALSDQGNGIWSGTVDVYADSAYEFKYTTDDWNTQENFVGGESCTVTNGGFTNRALNVMGDSTLGVVCWNACDTCMAPALPDSVMVTFQVDMTDYVPAFTEANLNGTFNGWCGACAPMTDQGNGVWATSVLLEENSSYEYLFTVDGWTDQEIWSGLEPCTTPPAAFVNRALNIGASDTTLNLVCFNSCDTCGAPPPDTVNVTFQVDMQSYAGTYSEVDVNGTWNGWCGTCNPLVDQGNDIWSATFPIVEGTHEFKFTTDGWVDQENFFGGESCTVTNGGNTNRTFTIDADTTFSIVCWDSCGPCSTTPQIPDTVNVTFNVDMSLYGSSFTTVAVGGTFNGWSPTANPLTDQGNGIWSGSLDLFADTAYEFLYSLDTAAVQETFAGGEPCTVTNFGFTNRALTVTGDSVLNLVCWETCDTCGAPPPPVPGDTTAVTFNVDMTNYTAAFTTVYVSGTMNGWNGTSNPLTDQGNNIWSGTIDVYADSAYEFKYTLDDWNVQENFIGGEPCTITTGGFTNRALNVMGDSTLGVVCWEACDTCMMPGDSIMVTFQVDMSEYTTAFTEANLNGTFNGWCGSCAPMTDQGNGVWSIDVLLEGNSTIEWKYTVDGWTDDEQFTGLEPCTMPPGQFVNRITTLGDADTTFALVCFNACDTCGAAPPDTVDVTFQVDMQDYLSSYTEIDVNGTWNAWCGTCNPLTDQGGGIWSATFPIVEGNHEFKFTVDGWTDQEIFVGGESCTINNGGNINRSLMLTSDTTLSLVCFNSCEACPPDVGLTATPTVISDYCLDNSGSITLSIANGVMPYTYAWSTGATSDELTGIGVGSYNVTVTDSTGAADTLTGITVTGAGAVLAATATVTNEDSGSGTGEIDLDVTGGNGTYTYEWSNGATTQDLSGLAGSTTYTVTVTDMQGCTTTASATVVLTGIKESLLRGNVRMFPNPANSQVTLTAQFTKSLTGNIVARDLSGRVLMLQTFSGNNISTAIELDAFTAGVYFVSIETAEGTMVQKLVVMQ